MLIRCGFAMVRNNRRARVRAHAMGVFERCFLRGGAGPRPAAGARKRPGRGNVWFAPLRLGWAEKTPAGRADPFRGPTTSPGRAQVWHLGDGSKGRHRRGPGGRFTTHRWRRAYTKTGAFEGATLAVWTEAGGGPMKKWKTHGGGGARTREHK